MKNMIKRLLFLILALIISPMFRAQGYQNSQQLNKKMKELQVSYPAKIKVHQLTKTISGIPLLLMEVGTETDFKEKKKPAIFVMGNPEGTVPLGSEATIKLTMLILEQGKTSDFTWYIMPTLSPEAHNHYFDKVKFENPGNLRKHNDDMDEATDEDGPDDLNNDGYITQMRYFHPEGEYIIDESDPRIMRKANFEKGEKGLYKIITEGIDNDKDGKYNEDSPGGINTGINFPFLFRPYTPTGGQWPGSEPEVYAVMDFIFNHPEIAASITFGNTDFSLYPPESKRKGSANFSALKIPPRYARRYGLDANKTYSMDEIINIVQPMMPPGVKASPSLIASFLGLGAAVNPEKEDLDMYKQLSEEYKQLLNNRFVNLEVLPAEVAKDGSFELWSYYHLGIPTFSMNFFTLPKPHTAVKVKTQNELKSELDLDKIQKMTSEEFLALGEEKIGEFLKYNKAPAPFQVKRVMEFISAGKLTPKQLSLNMQRALKTSMESAGDEKLKAILSFSDTELHGKGFIRWQEFNHPDLGKVEIGGPVPYVCSTPPPSLIDSLIDMRISWVFTLAEKLPVLTIENPEVNYLGEDIFELNVWVKNNSYIPYPIAMGERNSQPAPLILTIDADNMEVFEGKKRTSISKVEGNKAVKYHFLFKAKKGSQLKIQLNAPSIKESEIQIKLN